jgi:alkanesulfonate monooxygenase
VEYTNVIRMLLAGQGPVTFQGEFYRVDKLALTPPLPSGLLPGVLVSGSSEAGLAAARAMQATAVKYPEPPEQCGTQPANSQAGCGVRVGIIAREKEAEAWEIAEERFPADRKGQLTSQLATKVSDSVWRKKLTALGEDLKGKREVYWLGPYENYKTNCPYLVGSHEQVARELGKYIALGYRTYILDIPPQQEELEHIGVVFKLASQRLEP